MKITPTALLKLSDDYVTSASQISAQANDGDEAFRSIREGRATKFKVTAALLYGLAWLAASQKITQQQLIELLKEMRLNTVLENKQVMQ